MLAEVVLPSGSVVLIEGDAPGGPRDVGLKAKFDIDGLRKTIAEFADMLAQPLRAVEADQVELELSLGVELGTGHMIAFLTSGKASSGLKVRVAWKREA